MTLRDLITLAGNHPVALLGYFATVPIAAAVVGAFHTRGKGGRAPWRNLYATLVYLTAVPGVLAAVLAIAALVSPHQSLFDLDLLVWVVPLASMALTLWLIGRRVKWSQIPGSERLSALVLLLALTFTIGLLIERTRIWVIFGSSLLSLLVILALIFVLMRWALERAFGRAG